MDVGGARAESGIKTSKIQRTLSVSAGLGVGRLSSRRSTLSRAAPETVGLSHFAFCPVSTRALVPNFCRSSRVFGTVSREAMERRQSKRRIARDFPRVPSLLARDLRPVAHTGYLPIVGIERRRARADAAVFGRATIQIDRPRVSIAG